MRPLNGLFHVKQFFAELRCIQAQSISKACKSGINGKSEFQKQAAIFGAMPLVAELKRLWRCVLAEERGGETVCLSPMGPDILFYKRGVILYAGLFHVKHLILSLLLEDPCFTWNIKAENKFVVLKQLVFCLRRFV